MKGKRYTTEDKIRILRDADRGKNILEVCREHNISEVSFHRWKRQFGQMDLNEARKLKELERENGELKRCSPRHCSRTGCWRRSLKKMVSPSQKRRAVQGVVEAGLCSQRRACRYLGLHRSSHCYAAKQSSDWLLRLHRRIEHLSRKYPRLGYRKLVRLLRQEGWRDGRKLIQRIRRECDLRGQRWMKRPRHGRSTGTIPTKAQSVDHVWSWDIISDRTDNGGKLRILSLIDEHSRECLALHAARKLTDDDVIAVMEKLVTQRGAPGHIRSEFVARILQGWLAKQNIKTLYIAPASPWQNGHVESFHGSLRDECLDRELMLSVAEARVVIEDYRRYYNEVRPHGGIGYRTPAQAFIDVQTPNAKVPSHHPQGLLQRQKLVTRTT